MAGKGTELKDSEHEAVKAKVKELAGKRVTVFYRDGYRVEGRMEGERPLGVVLMLDEGIRLTIPFHSIREIVGV